MTSLLETGPVTHVNELCTINKHNASNACYRVIKQRRHILKSKDNTYKHKCYKFLRKKLRKYRLRQDGTEDQDVIDVSDILVSSLVIKSPNNEHESCVSEGLDYLEELRPKNYLSKMVRRKASTKISNGVKDLSECVKQNGAANISETPESMEKKHTNAFQLLMDSRNKSIGTNSPGKDQTDDYSDTEEVLKKKSAKAKRNLLLQKMADSKGYHKNKELDEYHDKLIKKKMDKRAERLKSMILKETKQPKCIDNAGNSGLKESNGPTLVNKGRVKTKQPKTFKIVDIFNTLNDAVVEPIEKKQVSTEDKEFINKLSPSLKKTESVLCYFKKVDKEPEICSIEVENKKTKKKGRKKKLSLKKDVDLNKSPDFNNENCEINNCVLIQPESQTVENSEVNTSNGRQKRKRISKADKNHTVDDKALNNNTESRPKRSIKKPVKYIDDVSLSSSDEDLHIFTPKKKKYVTSAENNIKLLQKLEPIEIDDEPVKPKNNNKKVKETSSASKKVVKLAPIFAAKQDSAALEAKQRFLRSGVPDKLKKIINHQSNNSKLTSDFPIVVHVQQSDSTVKMVHQPLLNIFKSDIDDVTDFVNEDNAFNKLLNLNEANHLEFADNKRSVKTILQNIKHLYPKFPVYRTYHNLRSKGKGEYKDYKVDLDNSIEVMNDVSDVNYDSPERLSWTDKYKASSTSHIIGNFESIKELRKWLISWTENELKSKNRSNDESDSDFYQSDTDSKESFKSMNNLLILNGPTGCGKTSSVYAVAADLSMKVIEVNASSKRTGKIMLQDLQEATQSHKVNRGTSTDSSQKPQEKNLTDLLKKNKKKGRPKKSIAKVCEKPTPLSQESTRTGMSLILIDDADVVFDQDDGFSSAIVQLVHCSKRPVILITSSLTCTHLQRFLLNGKVLKMCPLSPHLLGPWLDIMCLADSGISWPGAGAKFLNYFRGDIRKTINYLQFYISSYTGVHSDEERASQNLDNYKTNIDDENSGMSWAEREDLEDKQLTKINNIVDIQSNTMWTEFDNTNSDITITYPINLFNIWWSVPHLLAFIGDPINVPKSVNKLKTERHEVKKLESISDTLDALSLSDCMMASSLYSTADMTTLPWCSSDSDSMSEQDNIDYYMKKYEIGEEISHNMVSGCIALAQNVLNCEQLKKISSPGMSLQRKRDKIVSRHTRLTSYLNPCSILDRRSLTLDYWSSCRTICRIEKAKSDTNMGSKRHNRFCHYLKSASVLCTNDIFVNLSHSLYNEGSEININDLNG